MHEDVPHLPQEVLEISKTSLVGNSYWPRPSLDQTLEVIETLADQFCEELTREDVSNDEIEMPVQHKEVLTKASHILDINDVDVATRMENFLKANYIRKFVHVNLTISHSFLFVYFCKLKMYKCKKYPV